MNITYKLDDGTGTVEVKKWIDADSNPRTHPSDSKLVENAYVRVWGHLKSFANKRHVGAHVVRPLTDYNEIQYHLLEAAVVHLYFTRGPPEQFAANRGEAAMTHGGNGTVAGNEMNQTGVPLTVLSRPAQRVYQILKSSPQNNEGLHVHDVATKLGMQVADVLKAGEELVGHGKIYTTIDDNTWAILEM